MTLSELAGLDLHQVLDLGAVDWVMRVPFGLIYYHKNLPQYEETSEQVTAVYVPLGTDL